MTVHSGLKGHIWPVPKVVSFIHVTGTISVEYKEIIIIII